MQTFQSMNAMWGNAVHDLLADGKKHPSRAGDSLEVLGWSGRLENVSQAWLLNKVRKVDPAFAGAELLWYLSGRSEVKPLLPFASHYTRFANPPTAEGHANGAYGKRWKFNPGFRVFSKQFAGTVGFPVTPHLFRSQLDTAVYVLGTKPETRQAVVTCWDSADLALTALGERTPNDMPCTIALQFLLRADKLHCVGFMRSNDVWLGMPYDVLNFTNVQRVVASALGVEAGSYTHCVGSLHMYHKNSDAASAAIDEDAHVEPVHDEYPVTQMALEHAEAMADVFVKLALKEDGHKEHEPTAEKMLAGSGTHPVVDALACCLSKLGYDNGDPVFAASPAVVAAWNIKYS